MCAGSRLADVGYGVLYKHVLDQHEVGNDEGDTTALTAATMDKGGVALRDGLVDEVFGRLKKWGGVFELRIMVNEFKMLASSEVDRVWVGMDGDH
eukprot:CAMPEP_0175985554 /NCGR_PEP_ID=MMETSP0108-20121206/49635_1 /TAXON_ID=195067 ORGANISM="Goniomonas pacifica, Strain CCMP1869" /NCGR_SAMPLE_ID=MMETSP0108 /ASSEMBLY_ACC=CAM_ASM_000204 /LENGTH=94 /DNA_ID=CAMNT_0017316567 /DNA_START=103 /DNA_END=384 /DNA_ORIENTATION=-